MLTYAEGCRKRDSQDPLTDAHIDPQTDAHIEAEGGTSPNDVARGGGGGGARSRSEVGGGGGSRSGGGGRWGVRTRGSGQERCVYVYEKRKKRKPKGVCPVVTV